MSNVSSVRGARYLLLALFIGVSAAAAAGNGAFLKPSVAGGCKDRFFYCTEVQLDESDNCQDNDPGDCSLDDEVVQDSSAADQEESGCTGECYLMEMPPPCPEE